MAKTDDPMWGCDYPGCTEHPFTGGGPIFRVSPKGGPFVGLCRRHLHAEQVGYDTPREEKG